MELFHCLALRFFVAISWKLPRQRPLLGILPPAMQLRQPTCVVLRTPPSCTIAVPRLYSVCRFRTLLLLFILYCIAPASPSIPVAASVVWPAFIKLPQG